MRARGGYEGVWASGGDTQEPIIHNVGNSDATPYAHHTFSHYDEPFAARTAEQATTPTQLTNSDFDGPPVMPVDFGGGVWHWLLDDTLTGDDQPDDGGYHDFVGLPNPRCDGEDQIIDVSTDDVVVTCRDSDADDVMVYAGCNLRSLMSSGGPIYRAAGEDAGQDIAYTGTVGLLELRGGGAPAPGDVFEGGESLQAEPEDPQAACFSCHRRLEGPEDDWSPCLCGRAFCDTCMLVGCPRCLARLEPLTNQSAESRTTDPTEVRPNRIEVTEGHVRRIIRRFEEGALQGNDDDTFERSAAAQHEAWLDQHVGRGQGGGRGVSLAPWAVVSGEASGQPVRVCPSCGSSQPGSDHLWHHLRSGLFVCPRCSGTAERPQDTIHQQQSDHHDWPPRDAAPLSDSGHPGHGVGADGSHADVPQRPRQCLDCGSPLAGPGSTWRVCSCRGLLCESCWDYHGACRHCRGADTPERDICWGPAVDEFFIGDEGSSQHSAEPADVDPQPHDADNLHGSARAADCDCAPHLITPAQAEQLRARLGDDHRAALRERRTRSRATAAAQVRQGVRPRRPRHRSSVEFVSLNVNCANRLKSEVMSGDLFRCVDAAFVQEHREHGDGTEKLISWLRSQEWDPVAEDAYLKNTGYGGGPLIMSRNLGLRPLPQPPDHHAGRVCWGELDINGCITTASVYAISGQGIGKQLPLLSHIAQRVISSGLPFVLAGDWQLPPAELKKSEFIKVIDAEILSPGCPTNVQSGNELDYYVVSRSLLCDGARVFIDPSGSFSPHVAVRLALPIAKAAGMHRRLCTPRLLPVHPPIGPLQVPHYRIDWHGWLRSAEHADSKGDPPLTSLAEEWFAGAEVELIERHGMDLRDAAAYSGIGKSGTTVHDNRVGRYRNVADDVGLTGQRLSWAAKALWTVISAMCTPISSRAREGYLSLALPMSSRARAFRHEIINRPSMAENMEHVSILVSALQLLGKAGLQVRGIPPLIVRLRHCDYVAKLDEFKAMYNMVNAALALVNEQKHKRALRMARAWARTASDKAVHRATKRPEVAARKSASGDKAHRGELTDQAAAEHGMREWGGIWLAEEHDAGDDILSKVAAIYEDADPQDLPLVALPPLTSLSLRRGSLRFRSGTAVGVDSIRPRHFARLTEAALDALARLLTLFEDRRRWADIAREVIEVARGKKSGGARLVGLGSSIYRLWAGVRFADLRDIMESRVERPYLPAAPGMGSVRAVFDSSLTAESARAQGLFAATTGYDLKQYYEHIGITELAVGARRFGLPLQVTALLAHLYTGPRRIRVGQAVSVARFPRRSILAGCSFALLLIRLIIVKPAESLMKIIEERIRGWTASCHLTFYVDDGVITTVGDMDAVAFLHGWITRMVLNWVREVLRKSIATHKTTCVVSHAALRDRLAGEMKALGVTAKLGGEMLGIDYSAGGALRSRPTQVARRRKAVARRCKIAWLRRLGGPAHKVARQGALAEHTFGCEVIGLPPAALRDARAINGAAVSVQCGGASLTAKLALGGLGFSEHDPAVLHANPPMKLLLAQLWDVPRRRSHFVRAWYRAREVIPLPDDQVAWDRVNGPVSAAFAHLLRIGASWPKAFVIRALDSDINLLRVPPRTVMRIIAAHARRHLDHLLLRRLAQAHGWDVGAVLRTYSHGIHWDLVRDVLRGKRTHLTACEKRLLHVVSVGGFWPEERRWHCGLAASPVCDACGLEDGSSRHRLHDCGAFAAERALRRAAGTLHRLPRDALDPGLAPLLHMGLPPLPIGWREEECTIIEGDLPLVTDGVLYGDGSGQCQDQPLCRSATWSLIRLDAVSPFRSHPAAFIRGSLGGWDQTVPRAELMALIAFLRHSAAGALFVGDCRYVIEGARNGVSPSLMSSHGAHPDLWIIINSIIRDHGAPPRLRKVKAHRSQAAAAVGGEEELLDWHGNSLADASAKSLSRRRLLTDSRGDILKESEEMSLSVIACVAQGASMAVSRWPEAAPRTGRRRPRQTPTKETLECDDGGASDELHVVRRNSAGHFECAICRKVAYSVAGAKRLGKGVCGGALQGTIHQTHKLCFSHGLTWCKACGAFSSRWPRQLVHACTRRPRSQAQRNVLRRLLAGLTPTTAAYLSEAARAEGKPESLVDRITESINAADPDDDDRCQTSTDLHGRPSRPLVVARPRADPGAPGEPRRHGHNLRDLPGVSPALPPRVTRYSGSHSYPRLDERRMREGSVATREPIPEPNVVPGAAARGSDVAAPGPHNVARAAPAHRCSACLPADGHWSSQVAVGGPRSLTRCAVCDASTRLRCRACLRGRCIACLKARRPCLLLNEHETAADVKSAAPLVEMTSHQPSARSLSPPRRRARMQLHDVGREQGGDHHQRHHHRICAHAGGAGGALALFTRSASEGKIFDPASGAVLDRHHARVTVAEPPMPVHGDFSAAPSVMCPHPHHHHDHPEGGPSAHVATSPQSDDGGKEWHSESPRQRTVVFVPLLTDTVLPLSQGVVSSVDVAAEAADMSSCLGPPFRHLKSRVNRAADSRGGRQTMSTSAAAASSSCNQAPP